MTRRLISLVVLTAALAGCDTTDANMGLATAHNTAAEQTAAQAPAAPAEGDSAARGVSAVQRYLAGTVHQPVRSAAEPSTAPGDPGVPPGPR